MGWLFDEKLCDWVIVSQIRKSRQLAVFLLPHTHVFAYFEKHLSWRELITRTAKDSIQDDVAGIASQLSFFVFLSLFPALLFLVAIASFFPIVFVLASTGFGLVYYFAPDAEQEWTWITPGALAATLLWLVASLAFRFYVVNFGNYEEAYGTLGAIILTLLWFYITALVMVLGAELNAEIHRASPWAANPGPTIMGQRKRLGVAASRYWRQHAALNSGAVSLKNDTRPRFSV